MKIVFLGFVIHAVVLFSVLDVFIAPNDEIRTAQLPEVCPEEKPPGHHRLVILVTPGLSLLPEAARGHAELAGPVLPFPSLAAITGGLRKHPLHYHMYPTFDNILNDADLVVYAGPSHISDYLSFKNWVNSSFPKSWMHLSSYIYKNDDYVFNFIQNMLNITNRNKYEDGSKHKVIFFLYLTSIELFRQKFGENSNDFKKATAFLEESFYDLKRDFDLYFNDTNTIFFITSFTSKEMPLTVWGKEVRPGPAATVPLIDVCPLLASLLGLKVPLTSEGALPLSYLNMSEEKTARALLCNTLQLYQLAFGPEKLRTDKTIEQMKIFSQERKFNECAELCMQLRNMSQMKINNASLPLDPSLFLLVFVSLVGWTFFLLSEILTLAMDNKEPAGEVKVILSLIFALLALFGLFGSLYTRLSICYRSVMYFELPLIPWFFVIYRYNLFYTWCKQYLNYKIIIYIIVMAIVVEVFHSVLINIISSVIVVAVIAFLTLLPGFQKTPFIFSVWWYSISSLIILMLSISLDGNPTTKIVNFSGTLLLCISGASSFCAQTKKNIIITVMFVVLIGAAMLGNDASILVPSTPVFIQVMSWLLLFSVFIPLLGTKHVPDRLLLTCLGFIIPVFLLSGLHEPISFIFHVLYVTSWVFLERSYLMENITWHDFRRGILCFYMLYIAYELMGKVDSEIDLNSFWFRCFLLEENIYLMCMLLYLKYLCIFIVTMTLYETFLSKSRNGSISFIYCLLLVEVLALRYLVQFFFNNTSPEMNNNIFKHVFIHIFAICVMMARFAGHIYAGTLETKQFGQVDGFPSTESVLFN